MTSEARERDYLERTIATVRNHRGAENCWPQWANIFADEIERLWKENIAAEQENERLRAVIDSAGVDDIDPRLKYVYLQVGRAEWEALQQEREG